MEGLLSEDRIFESGDTDFKYILDSDVFHNVPITDQLGGISSSYYEYDYLFDDDPLLSDKMVSGEPMSPAQPHITSEHSYSLTSEPSSPIMKDIKQEDDLDSNFDHDGLDDMLPVSPENDHCRPLLTTDHQGATMATRYILSTNSGTDMMTDSGPLMTTACTTALNRVGRGIGNLDLATPTLSTTTLQQKQDGPKIKLELVTTMLAVDNGLETRLQLPPTPPSSTPSDSDGGDSPHRSSSSEPGSPRAIQPIKKHVSHARTVTQPLFTNVQRLPQSGPLILTEEEKRTLKQEGYPIPTKLPLTKAEEKSLKKVRRKIKNKISAQESRRKKKEYLEALEKRMDSYTHENTELRKKVETLETTNQSLLSQLTKLQSIVNKVSKPIKANSTQTGTCLMVLVLCFAVFLGSWTPHSFLSSNRTLPKLFSSPPSTDVPHPHQYPPYGPFINDDNDQYSRVANSENDDDDSMSIFRTYGPKPNPDDDDDDPYTTHTMRSSRMILSYEEVTDDSTPYLDSRLLDDNTALLDNIAPAAPNMAAAKMAATVGGQGSPVANLESGDSDLETFLHPDIEAKFIPVDTMALINRSSNK